MKSIYLSIVGFFLSIAASAQTFTYYNLYDKTEIPYSLSNNDPINDVAVVFADVLTVNTARKLSFIEGTCSHHVFIFANKLILRDTLQIDLNGYINANNNGTLAQANLTN